MDCLTLLLQDHFSSIEFNQHRAIRFKLFNWNGETEIIK